MGRTYKLVLCTACFFPIAHGFLRYFLYVYPSGKNTKLMKHAMYPKGKWTLLPLLLWTVFVQGQSDTLFQVTYAATASSTAANSSTSLMADGDLNTAWFSDNPFPDAYYGQPRNNVLLGQVFQTASNTNLAAATDGVLGNFTPNIPKTNGAAMATLQLPHPMPIILIGARLRNVQAPVTITLQNQSGAILTHVYGSASNNNNVAFSGFLDSVVTITLESKSPFAIYDFAAVSQPVQEFVTLDLGSEQWVKEIHTKHWTGTNATATNVYLGTHPDSLQHIQTLVPTELSLVTTILSAPIWARYVRIAHTIVPENFRRVSIFEALVFATLVPEPPAPDPVVWNPDAGIYPPLSKEATATATSTSNNSSPALVLDNNLTTAWSSNNPLPDLFVGNPKQNMLLGAVATTSNAVLAAEATDGVLGNFTPAITANGDSSAWLKIDLAPQNIHRLSLRVGNGFTAPVLIHLTNAQGQQRSFVYNVGTSGLQRFVVGFDAVISVVITSQANFQIQELAAYSAPLEESVTVDLGTLQSVGLIQTRHWNGAGNVISGRLMAGPTLDSLVEIATLQPDRLDAQVFRLPAPIMARYVQVAFLMVDENWKKATVQEITVFDAFGSYGPPPAPKPQNQTFAELWGVNTVWSWGSNKVPNMQGPDEGAQKFIRAVRNARNYHNIHWDTPDPDSIPTYTPQDDGQIYLRWTNWTREYTDWITKGFTVDATYTFDRFQESAWDAPYNSAYALGQAFGSRFGPANGNLIRTVEVGNEPWSYSDSTYAQILLGMAKGIKDQDPHLKVLPCALQAISPVVGNTGAVKNYIGGKLPEAAAPYLDGINLHLYSYIRNEQGVRLAVHPEHPDSEMRDLFNGLRFRDQNMPGKEVHVTEWGWDASSTNEIAPNSEAVSPLSQAVYALRGLFWLSRMGVDRAHWYFYSNVPVPDGQTPLNYGRSGLTESLLFQFKEKRSFYAAESMLLKMGHLYFDAVIQEDAQAYIYLLRDSSGAHTHLVAWRPVVGDDSLAVMHTLPSYAADTAWYLSGLSVGGEQIILQTTSGGLQLPLSSKPLLVPIRQVSQKRGPLKAELRVDVQEQAVSFYLETSEELEELGVVAGDALLEHPEGWQSLGPRQYVLHQKEVAPGSYVMAADLLAHHTTTNQVTFKVIQPFVIVGKPQPVEDWYALEGTAPSAHPKEIQIFALDGRLLQQHVWPAHQTQIVLPTSYLPSGTYLVQVRNPEVLQVLRMVKL